MSIGIFSSQNTNNPAIACRRFFAGPSFSRWPSTCSRLAGALALSLGSLAAFIPQAQAAGGNFGGGTGVAGNPYLVEDAADLAAINNDAAHLAASYQLAHDIDLSAWLAPGGPGYNSGAGWTPIGSDSPGNGSFTGSFDGAGHKITGLWIYRSMNYAGLFGLAQNATITNLGVEIADAGININGNGWSMIGGLVGQQNGGSITNSYASGDVSGFDSNAVGGLVGFQNGGGAITNSYATGNVSGLYVYAGELHIGGGIASYVGGLVGQQGGGSITSSYATGNASSSGSSVGGLVGAQNGGSAITNSYATGGVNGGSGDCSAGAGGLVGYPIGAITASFFDMQTTGQSNGVDSGSTAGATGKTTAEMQTQSTFTNAGWDFASASPVWSMPSGEYPKLAW